MEKNCFTKHEALSKINKSVKLLNDYAGMPKDTIGIISAIKNVDDQWVIVIKWCRPEKKIFDHNSQKEILVDATTAKSLIDWFGKDELETYFEELSK